MKTTLQIAGLSILIILIVAGINTSKEDNINKVSSLPTKASRADSLLSILEKPEVPYIFTMAHRADWRYAPENSLTGIKHCIEYGIEFLELDIRRTKDGKYVLMHDKTLDRTTNGTGRVADWPMDSLKILKLFNGYRLTNERIPTLEEALLSCKGKTLVKLDKSRNDILKLYPILKKLNMEKHVFFYGQSSYAQTRKELGPYLDSIQYIPQLSSENASLEYIQKFQEEYDPPIFEFFFNTINAPHVGLIQAVKQNSRVLVASTNAGWYAPIEYTDDAAFFKPEQHWGKLMDMGASVIITDSPLRLKTYLNSKN